MQSLTPGVLLDSAPKILQNGFRLVSALYYISNGIFLLYYDNPITKEALLIRGFLSSDPVYIRVDNYPPAFFTNLEDFLDEIKKLLSYE